MPAIARLGDTSSHGGSITTASSDTRCNGRGIARNNDSFLCPRHGLETIVASRSKTCNGRAIAAVGDLITCGAVITSGSPDTNVG